MSRSALLIGQSKQWQRLAGDILAPSMCIPPTQMQRLQAAWTTVCCLDQGGGAEPGACVDCAAGQADS